MCPDRIVSISPIVSISAGVAALGRKILYASALSFVLIFAVYSASAQDPEATLVIGQAVYDFGQVPQGTVVEHNFELLNTGPGVLKIRKIHPSCGCTAALLETDLIEAGDRAFLKTSFDTSGFQGKKVKTVRIYTNDPKQTSAVLTIQGVVKPDVAFDPERLDFGRIKKGEKPERTVVLKTEGSSVKILEVRSKSRELEIEKNKTEGDSQSFIVRITEELPVGIFRGRVMARTSSTRNPVVNLAVSARVIGAIDISPTLASFGLLSAPLTDDRVLKVQLVTSSGAPFKLISVASDYPEISAEYVTIEEGRKYQINIKLLKSAVGIIRGRVRVLTDLSDEDQKELSIPVYAIVNKVAKEQ